MDHALNETATFLHDLVCSVHDQNLDLCLMGTLEGDNDVDVMGVVPRASI